MAGDGRGILIAEELCSDMDALMIRNRIAWTSWSADFSADGWSHKKADGNANWGAMSHGVCRR